MLCFIYNSDVALIKSYKSEVFEKIALQLKTEGQLLNKLTKKFI